jgi:hypothetical protein
MVRAKVIRPTGKQPCVLLTDELDEAIVDAITTVGEVPLQMLVHSCFPEYNYQKIWRRVRSLNEWGLIRTGDRRGKVICFSKELRTK